MDLDLFCPICLESLAEADSIGLPNSCAHAFCSDCITAWSKCSSNCPVDRLAFSYIAVKDLEGLTKDVLNVNTSSGGDIEIGSSFVDNIFCGICRGTQDENLLLLCDGCDKGFHCFCLNPPLEEVPINEWYCDSCQSNLPSSSSPVIVSPSEPGPSSRPSYLVNHESRSPRRRSRRTVPRTRFVERIRQYIQVSREFAYDSDEDAEATHGSNRHKRAKYSRYQLLQGFESKSEEQQRSSVQTRRSLTKSLGLVKVRDTPGLSKFEVVAPSTSSGCTRFNKLDITGSNCAPVAIEEEAAVPCHPMSTSKKTVNPPTDLLKSIMRQQDMLVMPDHKLTIGIDGSIKPKPDERKGRNLLDKRFGVTTQGIDPSVRNGSVSSKIGFLGNSYFSETFMIEPSGVREENPMGSEDPTFDGNENGTGEVIDTSTSLDQADDPKQEEEQPSEKSDENTIETSEEDGKHMRSTTEFADANENNQMSIEPPIDAMLSLKPRSVASEFEQSIVKSENQNSPEVSPNVDCAEEANSQESSNFQSSLESPVEHPLESDSAVAEGLVDTETDSNQVSIAPNDSAPTKPQYFDTNDLNNKENVSQVELPGVYSNNEPAELIASSETENLPTAAGELEEHGHNDQTARPSAGLQKDVVQKFEDTTCEICECNHDEATMLLCDEISCNKGYHMACLDPPLFEVPEGDWACPKCRKRKEEELKKSTATPPLAAPPPFKPVSASNNESSNSPNYTGNNPNQFKGYEIPKKSNKDSSRLSLSDIAVEEPSAEELAQFGLPVQFNMNSNIVRAHENPENSGFGNRENDARGFDARTHERYHGRFDYSSRGWHDNSRGGSFGQRGARFESDRNNRGFPDRGRGFPDRGGRGGFGRFANDRGGLRGGPRGEPRISRWGDEPRREFQGPDNSQVLFDQAFENTNEHLNVSDIEKNVAGATEMINDNFFKPQNSAPPEMTASNIESKEPSFDPSDSNISKPLEAEKTEAEDISMKRERSSGRSGSKEISKESTDKESRRRSRSKSSDSRKRRRERSSSKKRSDDGDTKRSRDRRGSRGRDRDHDRHRSRRSRSRSRKRYDSDRHSRHDDRRSSRNDYRSRDSRHERDDRRSNRYDDDRRRGDYERNADSMTSGSNAVPVELNIAMQPSASADKQQLTPTKDEQSSETVPEVQGHLPILDNPLDDFNGRFQPRNYGGFGPPSFEDERPRFQNSFTPIGSNRFPRPPRQGFSPRFPGPMHPNSGPPFNAGPNAQPMPNPFFAQFDLTRTSLPNQLQGNVSFPNPPFSGAMNTPQNMLNARLQFPLGNGPNNVGPLSAPPNTIDPNVLQQFASSLANTSAAAQNAQSLSNVQELINSQANLLQSQQNSQQDVNAQPNVAALLRQIESNKLMQSVASLNAANSNAGAVFPNSPQQMRDSTPETPARNRNTGSSVSPISIAKVQSNMPMINSILESHFGNQQHMPAQSQKPLQQIFGGNLSFPSQNSSPELVEMEDSVVSPRVEAKPEKESVPFLGQLMRSVTSPPIPFMDGSDDVQKAETKPRKQKPWVKPVIPKIDSEDEKNSEIESSANEMQLKKKLNDRSELQSKVADVIKGLLMPHFKKKVITKDEYKDIMRKSVNKVVKRGSSSSDLKEEKIGKLVDAYVDHYKTKRSKGSKLGMDPDDF